jgi:hypothetical protein
MFKFICLIILLPSPSQSRELSLVLALCARPIHLVRYCILPGISNLMIRLTPLKRAGCQSVAIFHIKSTRETCIPIGKMLDRGWGVGAGCCFGSRKKWDHATKWIRGCNYPSLVSLIRRQLALSLLLVANHCRKGRMMLASISTTTKSPSTASLPTTSTLELALLATTI